MKISQETAHIWQKEAFFQQGRTRDFIQMCVEMDDLSPQEVCRRHPRKIMRLLLRDRNESRLELFSDEVILDTLKI